MRTKDVLDTGMERNFLRKCIKEGIITPAKIDSPWIINDNYIPQEYSSKDVDTVWLAYLYRKMGFSYKEIKRLVNGEEIKFRGSISALISDYESQLEELQLIVRFLKCVKGIGIIPPIHSLSAEHKNFKDFLSDYISLFDVGGVSDLLHIAEDLATLDELDSVDDGIFNNFSSLATNYTSHICNADRDVFLNTMLSLKDYVEKDPRCDEVKHIIDKMFCYQKQLSKNDNLTPWEFGYGYLTMLLNESDISTVYKKCLGEDVFKFLIDAIIVFLLDKEPEKMKEFTTKQ